MSANGAERVLSLISRIYTRNYAQFAIYDYAQTALRIVSHEIIQSHRMHILHASGRSLNRQPFATLSKPQRK